MKRQVILFIHDIPTKVELVYSTRESKTYHYAFGIINVQVRENTSLNKIEKKLNDVFEKSLIEQMNHQPFFNEIYCYVFGDPCLYELKPGKELTQENIRIKTIDGKSVSLKDLLKLYIEQRTRYYEEMMGLEKHEIHVKSLSAIMGNNHYTKKVLNFNDKLVFFSKELIDSVIIHELCHDFHQNHSQKFYDKLYFYCKDYDEKRKKLILGERK